ncbi:helix-turn-helix domain-containing protein [Prauserella cavernicola]|nr:helix-turn-helix domain-containing protein [Prauserella cavernicola]
MADRVAEQHPQVVVNSKLLTTDDLAAYLGVPKKTLYQ